MKPKVYVVANTGHDYSSAEQRGELVYLYDGKVNVFASDKLIKDLCEKLSASTPDDFLILSGNQLAASAAFMLMMHFHGIVNVLIYSFKHGIYEIRTIRKTQIVQSMKEVFE